MTDQEFNPFGMIGPLCEAVPAIIGQVAQFVPMLMQMLNPSPPGAQGGGSGEVEISEADLGLLKSVNQVKGVVEDLIKYKDDIEHLVSEVKKFKR